MRDWSIGCDRRNFAQDATSRNLLTVILAASVALGVYAAMNVARVDGYPATIALPLGVFGAFALFPNRPVKNEDRFYWDWRSYQISDHRPKWVAFVILTPGT